MAAGILPSRARAQSALLRMFSRARRQQRPLLLVAVTTAEPAEWLTDLAADWRIGDLAWRERGGRVLALFEEAENPAGVLARLRERARACGAEAVWGWAQFPQGGLTLEALLEHMALEAEWATR